jgi:hypothetical protein
MVLMVFLLMRLIYNIAVIVVPIKAAERKLCVYLVFGFHFVSVMTRGSNQIVNLLLRKFPVVVHNFEIFAFRIPIGDLDAREIKRRFNPILAHGTVSKNLDIGFSSFSLGVCTRDAKCNKKYDKKEFRFHDFINDVMRRKNNRSDQATELSS